MSLRTKAILTPGSHDCHKLVTNLNNNELKTSDMQFEDCALKLNASDFACRSKGKVKPQR